MTSRQFWPTRLDVTLVVVLTLFLAACSPPAGQSGTTAPDPNPACDLITPEIAAKAEPGLVRVGQAGPAKPPGSDAYLCTYSNLSKDAGETFLSVALTSPASAAAISEAKSTSDCSPVTGIGDFACLQWTGYFRGEAGGASANVILTAVNGNETLEMPYVAAPPMDESGVPDGNAMAHALSQAAVDAGWGNGTALSVPAAPPVGPPTTTTGEPLDGIGDKASFIMSTEPAGPKSLRPAGDVPITILSVMVVRDQNLATFTADVLISPTGPTAEQTKDQLITLVRDVEF